MEDRTPDTPPESTPNPHRGEPAPPPEEGFRPEADAEVVRPAEDEPNGPISGLVHGAATKVEAEFTHHPEAEAEAERLGVEGEGVEAGQILGLVAATVVSIVCLILFLYFLFYLPQLNTTQSEAADVPEARYEELRENRAEAAEKINQYATSPDTEGQFRIPIEAAMARVAAPAAGQAPAADAPVTRSAFNVSGLTLSPAPAVAASAFAADTAGVQTPPEADAPGAADDAPTAPSPDAPTDDQE